jgi:hypothetical protein
MMPSIVLIFVPLAVLCSVLPSKTRLAGAAIVRSGVLISPSYDDRARLAGGAAQEALSRMTLRYDQANASV